MTAANRTPGEPAELDALVALAQREHRAGRLAEAAAAYRKILAIRPDIAEAHNNLGIILAQQGKLDEARHGSSKRSLSGRTTPKRTTTWAMCCSSQGKLDEAAARYEQALALRPDYAEAHNNLGIIARQQGKLDQAAARYRASARSPAGLCRSAQQPGQRAAAAGQARPGRGTVRASAGSPAGLCRGAQQPGQRAAGSQGKLDEAAARYRASAGSPARLCRSAQQPGQHPLEAGQARRGRRHVTSKRWLSGRTMPRRTTTWAIVLATQGKLDEAAARYRASAGSPAGLRRRAIGPGRLLFGRRGLRAWLACV